MDDFSARVTTIITVAKIYFPFVSEVTFNSIFRVSLKTACQLIDCYDEKNIRNVLLLFFHLRHYLVMEAACVIFNISQSQYSKIIESTVDIIISKFGNIISDSGRMENHSPINNCAFLVVDATEVQITRSSNRNYSGKKKQFTLKYQILVGISTGKIHHIYGPVKGRMHDSKLFNQSKVGDWLLSNGEFCIGDLGYIGCSGVICPHKRTIELSEDKKKFNKELSATRSIVERTFGNIKKWQILRHTYRGAIVKHSNIFYTCCIITELMNVC